MRLNWYYGVHDQKGLVNVLFDPTWSYFLRNQTIGGQPGWESKWTQGHISNKYVSYSPYSYPVTRLFVTLFNLSLPSPLNLP